VERVEWHGAGGVKRWWCLVAVVLGDGDPVVTML